MKVLVKKISLHPRGKENAERRAYCKVLKFEMMEDSLFYVLNRKTASIKLILCNYRLFL